LQNQSSVDIERKKTINSNIGNYKLELNELNDQLKNTEQLISENQTFLEDFTTRISQKENEKLFVISDLDRYKNNLEEKRQLLKSQTELLLEKVKEIANKENELCLDKLVEGKSIYQKTKPQDSNSYGNIAKTVAILKSSSKRSQI
jgi:chromosome segregation ATPase